MVGGKVAEIEAKELVSMLASAGRGLMVPVKGFVSAWTWIFVTAPPVG
jgi:hypothetical protein